MSLRDKLKKALKSHEKSYDSTCSREKLGQIFTTASEDALDEFYNYFALFCRGYNILDETHENFFLAEVKAEVGTDLISVRESLNYDVVGLEDTFKYYSNNHSEANTDGRTDSHSADQPAIGAKAYGDRLGNAPATTPYEDADGYVFRGGGFFQLTGRDNYQAVTDVTVDVTGMALSAEDIANRITEVGAGVLSAMGYWSMNDMQNCDTIDNCTAIINYYTDTYEEREEYYEEIAAIPAEGN